MKRIGIIVDKIAYLGGWFARFQINNKPQADTRRAREFVVARHAWDKIGEALAAVLAEASRDPRAG